MLAKHRVLSLSVAAVLCVLSHSAQAKAEIPECKTPLGTIRIVETEENGRWWEQQSLPEPSRLIKVFVQQSRCFRLVDRGAGLEAARAEREMAASGELRANSNIGLGQMLAADYALVPDIVVSNANAGGGGVGASGSTRGGGMFGLGKPDVSANFGMNWQTKSAHVVLSAVDIRTSELLGTMDGKATVRDKSFKMGGTFARMLSLEAGGYANTEMGQVIAAAYLQAYADLVEHIQEDRKSQGKDRKGLKPMGKLGGVLLGVATGGLLMPVSERERADLDKLRSKLTGRPMESDMPAANGLSEAAASAPQAQPMPAAPVQSAAAKQEEAYLRQLQIQQLQLQQLQLAQLQQAQNAGQTLQAVNGAAMLVQSAGMPGTAANPQLLGQVAQLAQGVQQAGSSSLPQVAGLVGQLTGNAELGGQLSQAAQAAQLVQGVQQGSGVSLPQAANLIGQLTGNAELGGQLSQVAQAAQLVQGVQQGSGVSLPQAANLIGQLTGNAELGGQLSQVAQAAQLVQGVQQGAGASLSQAAGLVGQLTGKTELGGQVAQLAQGVQQNGLLQTVAGAAMGAIGGAQQVMQYPLYQNANVFVDPGMSGGVARVLPAGSAVALTGRSQGIMVEVMDVQGSLGWIVGPNDAMSPLRQ